MDCQNQMPGFSVLLFPVRYVKIFLKLTTCTTVQIKEADTMKKTVVVLVAAMAAMFCVALAGCGGGGGDLSDSKYVGAWQAVSISLGDEEGAYDETCIMILNGDGTGTIESADEVTEFTWELTDEGFKTKGDMKMKFVDNGDDTISGKVFGTRLNFERK